MNKYTLSIKREFNLTAPSYSLAYNKNAGRKYLSKIETDFIESNIQARNKHFLDLGVGNGRNARIILKKSNKLTGLDLSRKMIDEVKRILNDYYKGKRLNLIEHDLNQKLPFNDSTFDGAICFRVIKYVKNWKNLISEVSRILKPKSLFLIEISNRNSVQYISEQYSSYITFNPREFEQELFNNGLIIMKKVVGSKLPFFFYDKAKNNFLLHLTLQAETVLNFVFRDRFSRNIMYFCLKD